MQLVARILCLRRNKTSWAAVNMKVLKLIPRTWSKRVVFNASVLVFRAALDTMYVTFVYPVFAYTGFNLNFHSGRLLESWLLVALVLALLPKMLRRPSDFFVLVLALGLVIPMTSLFGLSDKPRFVMYSVFVGFCLVCLARSGARLRLPTVRHGTFLALSLSFGSLGLVLIWMSVSGGFALLNFDLLRVYELREEASELIGRGAFAYLNLWVFKVFNVFLFAYALHRRSWILAACIFALQVVFFGISANKGVLFYPLMVFAIWYYLSKSRELAVVPIGLTFVVLASGAFWWISDIAFLGSFLVRRVFFVNAYNAFDYFEFFETHGFVYWSNSLTSTFLQYPYETGPAELIGEWRGTLGHVNNTFIANGYMHAGLIGLSLYCVLVGFLFRIIDSLATRGTDAWMSIAVTVVPMWSLLLSSDLPTAIMTHGLGVSVLLLFIARGARMKATPKTMYLRGASNVLKTAQRRSVGM